MKKISFLKVPLLLLLSFVISNFSFAQQARNYQVHDRGMLHETEFNTGEIGRAWETGPQGETTDVPLFEWPANSNLIINNTKYSGQENILGAGIYIAANPQGKPGFSNRLFAMCGAVGANQPEVAFGQWSFPISITKINNFPVLPNGKLNPSYNPDEAEQIITAKWASSVGITVTRTSRQWSYPDYDDMIIYEYTFVYDGDTTGIVGTPGRTVTLNDVMIAFQYGFAPSMYGYQREYGNWKYNGGIYRGDQNNFWDARYWLTYNMNLRTNGDATLPFKPESDPVLFLHNAQTGENGGGLNSPQAPGYCILQYDTTHLAYVDPTDSVHNESEATSELKSYLGSYYELDANHHILQPWSNKVSTGNTNSAKEQLNVMNPSLRWSGVYSPGSSTWPNPPQAPAGYTWIGRAAYPYRQSADAGQKHTVFGPYTMHLGDTLKFAVAEVVGYGAQPGDSVEGGQTTKEWSTNPSLNIPITINGQKLTNDYLKDFGYPDYVNSDVRNVTQVADKAFTAYLGHEPTVPVWPENNPRTGNYKIPIPFPAPVLVLTNTDKADIRINWTRDVENFTAPRLMGQLAKFNIYRSNSAMGPWSLVASINKGDLNYINSSGEYEYIDSTTTFKVGDSRYYSVTSVDEHGDMSGKTNIISIKKDLGAVDKLGKVYVVPNPFIVNSGFSGIPNAPQVIGFYGLPKQCTIRIFSYNGHLVQTIQHNAPVYSSTEWYQITSNNQSIASGVYFFVVTTPDGTQSTGKFIVIK